MFVSVFVCWQFWVKILIVILLVQSLKIHPRTLAFSKFVIEIPRGDDECF